MAESPGFHEWARRHLDLVCYPVLSDALRSAEAHAALIATPPSLHKAAVLEALNQMRVESSHQLRHAACRKRRVVCLLQKRDDPLWPKPPT